MKKIMISLFAIALLLVGCGSKSGENFEESNIKQFRQTNNDEVQSMLDYAIKFEVALDEEQATVFKGVELSELSDGEYYWLINELSEWLNANYMKGVKLPLYSETVFSFNRIAGEMITLAEENEIEMKEIE